MSESNQVPLTLSGISAGCSLVVVLLAVLFNARRQLVVQRLSFRLQVGICVVDLVKNIGLLLSLNGSDGAGCSTLGFFNLFIGHTFLLLNISLVINAHWVLLRNHPPRAGWVFWFWVTPVLGAAFLNLPLLCWSLFGVNEGGLCFIKKDFVVLEFIYIYGLYMVGFVYCLCIAILVLLKLKQSPDALLVLQFNLDPTGQKRMGPVIRDVMVTMPSSVSFPLVICISIFFSNIFMAIDFVTNFTSPLLFSWGYFGFNTIGILNLLAFLGDPLVRRALIAPPPSFDEAQEYNLNFGTKQVSRRVLDSDSEYGGEEVTSGALSWSDKQYIKSFINST